MSDLWIIICQLQWHFRLINQHFVFRCWRLTYMFRRLWALWLVGNLYRQGNMKTLPNMHFRFDNHQSPVNHLQHKTCIMKENRIHFDPSWFGLIVGAFRWTLFERLAASGNSDPQLSLWFTFVMTTRETKFWQKSWLEILLIWVSMMLRLQAPLPSPHLFSHYTIWCNIWYINAITIKKIKFLIFPFL